MSESRRPYLDLLLISFTILFFELACIRYFGAMVVFLTFFTNIILMASFLGMSVGLLATGRSWRLVRWTLPTLLVAIALAWLTLWSYQRLGRVTFDVGQSTPQQIFFGTEDALSDPSRFVIPIEVVAGVFFVLVAVMFTGLGQVMGRAFASCPDRVRAYTADIIGSIGGIVAFALLSWLRTPPVIWFAVVVVCCLQLIRPLSLIQLGLAAAVLVVGTYSYGFESDGQVQWSPYYKIVYHPQYRSIWTNNLGHQVMMRVPEEEPMYIMPHHLARDAGNRSFDDVLIIGAGSGNDVAAALLAGAKHVDAVEIDPAINALGRAHHPNRPYSDPRVTVHLDDGRSFLRTTDKKYDLVIYALVDSLVLHSSYSSLRLESFLFTQEAIDDVKRVLKPGGMFAMYNLYRQGWVVGRLVTLAQRATGAAPLVISLPYLKEIRAADSQSGFFTVILVDAAPGEQTIVNSIRRMLESQPPDGNWRAGGIGASKVYTENVGPVPRDDWPMLYLRGASIPWVNVRGMIMIGVLSLVLLFIFAPVRTVRLNWTMFFLGAGFMLLETKGVVHMALLFGATWVVNSIVFAAILVMILCGNLFVMRFQPRRVIPYGVLLIVALLVNAIVPMSTFLSLPGVAKVVVSCAVVFAPIFFAAVLFATLFRDSPQPDVDFGSNVAGIVLGGLSEYFSLMLGFNHMLLIAIGFYMLALLLRTRLGVAATGP